MLNVPAFTAVDYRTSTTYWFSVHEYRCLLGADFGVVGTGSIFCVVQYFVLPQCRWLQHQNRLAACSWGSMRRPNFYSHYSSVITSSRAARGCSSTSFRTTYHYYSSKSAFPLHISTVQCAVRSTDASDLIISWKSIEQSDRTMNVRSGLMKKSPVQSLVRNI